MGSIVNLKAEEPHVICSTCEKKLKKDVEMYYNYDSSEMALFVTPCKECLKTEVFKKLKDKNKKLSEKYGFELEVTE